MEQGNYYSILHPNVDEIESEDIAEYFDIYEAIGDKPGER